MFVRNGERLGSVLLSDKRTAPSTAGAKPKAPAKAETKASTTTTDEKPKAAPSKAKADDGKEG